MAILKICDRCGEIVKYPYRMRYETIDKDFDNDSPYMTEVDLCDNCRDYLKAFMRGEAILAVQRREYE